MTDEKPGVLGDVSFCHLVIGVTDMDRALAFYRDLLGMEVVFETLISGEPFDAVLHAKRQQEGRVVGGLLGGLMVELLSLGAKPVRRQARASGHHRDPQRLVLGHRSRRHPPPHHRRRVHRPIRRLSKSAGFECFSSKTPTELVEFIELPGGARSTYEMHRGVQLHLGPVR